jgi:hypothetical protein
MSATFFGSEVKYTKRYRLGQLLGQLTRHLLLKTATPHNGKPEDFQLFMALLDSDRFEGRSRDGVHTADVSDLMRRLCDAAERYHPEDVTEEIRRRLAEEAKHRGDFSKVQVCPASASDVVDEPEAKLVILSPDYAHSAKADSSAGRQPAAEVLNRGSAGRNCGNMLVFLAADKTRFADLDKAVRSFLAWQSIEKETVSLNLTPFQANQVQQRLASSD